MEAVQDVVDLSGGRHPSQLAVGLYHTLARIRFQRSVCDCTRRAPGALNHATDVTASCQFLVGRSLLADPVD